LLKQWVTPKVKKFDPNYGLTRWFRLSNDLLWKGTYFSYYVCVAMRMVVVYTHTHTNYKWDVLLMYDIYVDMHMMIMIWWDH